MIDLGRLVQKLCHFKVVSWYTTIIKIKVQGQINAVVQMSYIIPCTLNKRLKQKNNCTGIVLVCLITITFIFHSCSPIEREHTIVTSPVMDKNITGLRVYNPDKCDNGYTLFAHNPIGHFGTDILTSPIYLIDMYGEIVHQWMVKVPAFHARLLPNGNVMYHTTTATRSLTTPEKYLFGLYEIDPNSNVKWFQKARINHDFQLLKDESILFAENDERFPVIKIINRNHDILWEWKVKNHLLDIEGLLGTTTIDSLTGDWAHNNTVELLTDTPTSKVDRRFRKGNILFCFCNLDIIGVIDYPSGKIVWTWGEGILSKPHAPTMLKNGNILIFDNGCDESRSRIIEMSPISGKIIWEYHADPPETFYSKTISNAQRLPNGNTLICEGNSSRLFEITPEGKVVWDFISTFNRTTGGAGIYRCYRYSQQEIESLLKARK